MSHWTAGGVLLFDRAVVDETVATEVPGPRTVSGRWRGLLHRPRLVLAAIVVLGLLVRLAHAWAIVPTAFPRIPLASAGTDMNSYWEWARQIRAGDVLGRDTYHPSTDWIKGIATQEGLPQWLHGTAIFHWAPLYPYALALLQILSGGSLVAVTVIQLVLGAAQPLSVYLLARRLFEERTALVAAGLVALYGPLVFYEGVILRDWIPPILEPLVLATLLQARQTDRARDWCAGGLGLAVAILVRESTVLLVPVVALWLVWERWPAWVRMGRALACVGVALLVGLSPLMVRNALVGAPLLAVSDRAIQAVVDGNAVSASPIGYSLDVAVNRRILERADGTLRSTIVETLRTYEGDWRRYLGKEVAKLRGLVDPYEVPNNTSFYYGLDRSPVLRWLLRYGALFPLGVAGLALSLRRWRVHRLVYGYLGTGVAVLLVGVVIARYRLIFVPVLAVYAGALLVGAADACRRRRFPALAGMALLVTIIAMAQHWWLPLADPARYPRHQEYFLAAAIYAGDERFDLAVREMDGFRRRLAGRPELRAPTLARVEGNIRAGWAARLLRAGHREEARRATEQAAAVYAWLGPDVADPPCNLGQLYLALGDRDQARQDLERCLTLEPAGPRADHARRLLHRLEL